MSFLEICVALAVVSMLVGGIFFEYSGRAYEARLVADLEEAFANRSKKSDCPEQLVGVWNACYINKSGIVEATYKLPVDSNEKQRVLKALVSIGGYYDEESSAVTFERLFVSRHKGSHRAFRYLLNEEVSTP